MSASTEITAPTTTAPTSNRATHTSIWKRAGLALVFVTILGACGGAQRPHLVEESSSTIPAATSKTSLPATDPSAGTPTESFRAISTVDTLAVFDQPGDSVASAYLDQRTEFGSARVLLVEKLAGDWVQVRLSQRPNESVGWVAARDVKIERLEVVVTVDLAARELLVIENGVITSRQTVAVGSADNPTPVGTFFVTDKLDTPNDGGAYGPYAIGLSAYSETLSEFAGGNGQIGIHGTNDPGSIGQPVSHGCIRLPNDIITILANDLPLGTMVVIS